MHFLLFNVCFLSNKKINFCSVVRKIAEIKTWLVRLVGRSSFPSYRMSGKDSCSSRLYLHPVHQYREVESRADSVLLCRLASRMVLRATLTCRSCSHALVVHRRMEMQIPERRRFSRIQERLGSCISDSKASILGIN